MKRNGFNILGTLKRHDEIYICEKILQLLNITVTMCANIIIKSSQKIDCLSVVRDPIFLVITPHKHTKSLHILIKSSEFDNVTSSYVDMSRDELVLIV